MNININLSALRPSTIARVLEDTAIAGAGKIKNVAKSATSTVADAAAEARREIEIEQRARAIVKARAKADDAKLVAMTDSEIAAMQDDVIAVHRRAAELRAKAEAKA